jgi:hypothetical protein
MNATFMPLADFIAPLKIKKYSLTIHIIYVSRAPRVLVQPVHQMLNIHEKCFFKVWKVYRFNLQLEKQKKLIMFWNLNSSWFKLAYELSPVTLPQLNLIFSFLDFLVEFLIEICDVLDTSYVFVLNYFQHI